MDIPGKEFRSVDSSLSAEPVIGRWLWAMQDARRRTLAELDGVAQPVIDWLPDADTSSIGSLLYHIAAVEVDWLYEEVLVQGFPPQVELLLPYAMRDGQGRLKQVQGFSLEQHLKRLELVRGLLLDTFQRMDLADFRRARSLPRYDVTPEWVLHHLLQHEAEHRSQIGALRHQAERALAALS
jgi:uncharacterized damage-inducible protein DinB